MLYQLNMPLNVAFELAQTYPELAEMPNTIRVDVSSDLLPLERLLVMAGLGVEIKPNTPPFFLIMPAADLDEPVFTGLPNAIGHTWRTWRDEAHPIQFSVNEEVAVFGLNPFGENLTIPQLQIIANHLGDEWQLLSAAEFQTIWQEEE